MAQLEKIALDQAARSRDEFWSQLVVGEANGSLFKVAKGIRETNWHSHDDQEDNDRHKGQGVCGGNVVKEGGHHSCQQQRRDDAHRQPAADQSQALLQH